MSDTPITGSPLPRVAVFEAVNDSLKETYLGTTADAPHALADAFTQRRPRAASHWAPQDRVSVSIVEPSLSIGDARDFIRHYAASLEAAGWKPLSEDG